MNPWEGRELSLDLRESKQLLSALHGLPLNADGKPRQRKGLWGMNVDNNTTLYTLNVKGGAFTF